ncbi:MAG: hypothetical protein ABSA79_07430 [Candidatus Bathyarchaeia archaeon]|jgi:hypothetical protein
MKNKHIVATKSSGKKDIPKESEKAELGFERLLVDAGRSKKAADELLKWYTNSS